jgi:hypothetical protein
MSVGRGADIGNSVNRDKRLPKLETKNVERRRFGTTQTQMRSTACFVNILRSTFPRSLVLSHSTFDVEPFDVPEFPFSLVRIQHTKAILIIQ